MNKKERMYARIISHGNGLIEFFNLPIQDPIALSKKLFRLENKAHDLAIRYTNGLMETNKYETEANKILVSLSKIIGKNNMKKVFINGDPRGYALKIDDKYQDRLYKVGIYRDWGGYGIIAPDFSENI